ncbi:sugar ABC transporter substrate-binding protein [Salinibacterium sp. SWN139]|uniref:ABC transporter substrate-binding protein n=1 Tax=Salinibacterium sp. SWN139 TaxID=2792055 RepID=UPI0018CDCD4E|nr:sugar ABC transporter substrate-binding protein [Salinibacterium sp. SWN139]MBH0052551.1 sugar ABC transporter substrate-binding protein [Salinibacterium sp. SWN139]
MRSAKWLTAAGLLTTATLVLTGCSAASSDDKATDVDLRMTVWTSNEDHLAMFDSIADAYIAEHPEIASITFDPLPFDDYTTTLTTQVAGGKSPDLAWILENTAPDFVDSGALVPIQEALEATEGYEYEDLSDAATKLWKSDGSLVAYPFSTSPLVMFVNNDLLAEAGQPTAAELRADGMWEWESVAAASSEVNSATGKAGFVIRDFDYTSWDNLASIWDGWGAQPWSDDGATCEFASDEMIDAFSFIHDAAFESSAMPGPGTTADFFAGESAFTVTQISRASLLAEGGFNWDLLPLPAGPAGEYSIVGQAGIGVMSQGENPDAATGFLAYFSNPENSELLAQWFPPARNSQLNAETLAAANPVLSAEQIEDVVVPGILTGVVRQGHTDSAKISQTVRASLDAMWTADADVPAVLQGVCDAVDPLL